MEYFNVLIIDYSKLHGLSGEIPFLTDNGLTRVTGEIPFLTDETSRVILNDLTIATKFTRENEWSKTHFSKFIGIQTDRL